MCKLVLVVMDFREVRMQVYWTLGFFVAIPTPVGSILAVVCVCSIGKV